VASLSLRADLDTLGLRPHGRRASGKVLRGGSFNNNRENASSSYRNNNNPHNANNNIGFRVGLFPHLLLTLWRAGFSSRLLPVMTGDHGLPSEVKAEVERRKIRSARHVSPGA